MHYLPCLWPSSPPAFADDPPGKQDSPVSPLLQQYIEQRQSASGQSGQQPSGDSVTRSLPGSDAASKFAAIGATEDSGTSDTTDDPVRFDARGNVQVYIHLENTDTDTLQQLRDLGPTSRSPTPTSTSPRRGCHPQPLMPLRHWAR